MIPEWLANHPKLYEAGPAAWLYVCAARYVEQYQLNGRIDVDYVPKIANVPDDEQHDLICILLRIGLWEHSEDDGTSFVGYRIVPLRASEPAPEESGPVSLEDHRRSLATRRQREWRHRKRDASTVDATVTSTRPSTESSTSSTVTSTVTSTSSTPAPIPVPVLNSGTPVSGDVVPGPVELIPVEVLVSGIVPEGGVGGTAKKRTPQSSPSTSASTPTPRIIPEPEPIPEPLASFAGIVSTLAGFRPTKGFWTKVAAKYSALDLEEEAIKMDGWLSEPENADRNGNTQFILGWLTRALKKFNRLEQAEALIPPLSGGNGHYDTTTRPYRSNGYSHRPPRFSVDHL